MLLRLVIEAEAKDPQAAKENLAMALEQYAPARVVEVAPIYRQEQMRGMVEETEKREEKYRETLKRVLADLETMGATKEELAMALERYAPARVVEVAPVYRQTEMAGACGHAPLREKIAERILEGTTEIPPADTSPYNDLLQAGSWGVPTEKVVGPFARADAAFRAAVEATEEIRR